MKNIIDGTLVQVNLVEWKLNNGCYGDSLGKVGTGYWRGFRKRKKDKFVSKKGLTFEIDRESWSTYANFNQMYK